MERFDVIGNADYVFSPVNPVVSYAPLGTNTTNYATNKDRGVLEIMPLYTVMKKCASGDWKNLPKGSHSIHVYKSDKKGVKPYVFDGVLFIDLDKFVEHPELKGFQDVIFNRFDELCEDMGNLLCIKYSPSGNLHVYAYHKDIKDSNHYSELEWMYTCLLAKVIKHRLGVDLRDYDGVMDTHLTNPDWQLNVNDSPVRWNVMCNSIKLTKSQKETLIAEYGGFNWNRRVTDVSSTIITGTGDINVDRNFVLLGWKGYDARTRIGATAYIHFKRDLDATNEWLASKFSNAGDIQKQLHNLIKNGRVDNYYFTSVERYLFGDDAESVIIPEDKYLSDMIDFSKLDEKYYYFNAGTGSGKTELVKGFTKTAGTRIVILQMNKALRDGKKHGIEDITYDNFRWEDSVSKDRIHTTIEGFNRNCKNLDLSGYTVIVDEAHLLQDYSAIDGKRKEIVELLNIIPAAERVIFMSATPKSEVKLFPFRNMKFVKTKDQELDIVCHPLKYDGKGSKEATRYSMMNKYIRSIEGKHIIFSNKHQECWKKYGLDDVEYTWFHSQNINDERVISILRDNRLLTDITLATIYLGVGVEIKNEDEVHIWFDLNEGWDKAFVEQAIGRPRDAERIHLHFFYTEDVELKCGVLSDDEVDMVEHAFGELIVDVDERPTVNLIAAKITGVYDANFNTYECKDKVKLLKLGQIVSGKDYFTVNDVELLKQLPYKNVSVRFNKTYNLNTDGKKRYMRNETVLQQHLCSRSDSWWREISDRNMTYDDILNELTGFYKDKKNARSMLEDCKYIWKSGVELSEAEKFFESMNLASDIMRDVNDYCEVKAGVKVLKEFVGAEEQREKITLSFRKIESAFTKEYLEYRIECMMLCRAVRPYERRMSLNVDPLLTEFLDVDFSMDDEREIPYPFKTESWKETLKKCKPSVSKSNGKNGGAKKQEMMIVNTETNETITFSSKKECMEYLGVGSKAFSRFVKGEEIKKLKKFKIFSIGVTAA